MTVAVPGPTAAKVTEHWPAVSVQLVPTVPTEVSDEVKLTVALGVLSVFVMSVTVTVHVDVSVAVIVLGVQETLVDVVSFDDACVWKHSFVIVVEDEPAKEEPDPGV